MHGNGWKFQKTCIFTQIFQQNRKKWIFWKIDVFSKVLVFWNGRRIKILHFWTFFDETLGDCSKILYYNLRKFRPKKCKNEEFLCVVRFNRSIILPQKRRLKVFFLETTKFYFIGIYAPKRKYNKNFISKIEFGDQNEFFDALFGHFYEGGFLDFLDFFLIFFGFFGVFFDFFWIFFFKFWFLTQNASFLFFVQWNLENAMKWIWVSVVENTC